MFIPKFFKVEDLNEIAAFLQENAFGILVSVHSGKPVASHIPLTVNIANDTLMLRGHLANANIQVEDLNEDVMVIFQGPHAYVSSSWYGHDNVSTWNYQAVHIYGKSRVLSEDELREDLIDLLDKYEAGRENAKTWDNLDDASKKQINGITGFEIVASEVQAAYKLSQNRNAEDYDAIISHLKLEKNAQSGDVADAMTKIKEGHA